MNTNEMIKAWKNAETTEKNPVSVNEELITQIHGGAGSSGYVCSVSGECNSSGRSCWDALRDLIGL